MLDNVGLRLESVSWGNYNQILERIGATMPLERKVMNVKWHNMRLTYYPNAKRLVLKNSLHKLYNNLMGGIKDSNSNDFHLADLNVLVDLFSIEYFDRDASDFKITDSLESGLNINTGYIKPFDIVNRWLSFKENEFYASVPRKGKPLLKASCLSDYRVKGYDKGKQSGIYCEQHKNILRYEIAVGQLRKVRTILGSDKNEDVSLSDLNEHEAWVTLYYNLLENYDAIKKIPFLSSEIDRVDINELYGYISPLMAEDIKRTMHKSSYNKWRAKSKKVYEKYDSLDLNIHNMIRHRLKEKFIDICN